MRDYPGGDMQRLKDSYEELTKKYKALEKESKRTVSSPGRASMSDESAVRALESEKFEALKLVEKKQESIEQLQSMG